MLKHEKEIVITPEFIDQNNHVNNVQYVQWVEMIANEHWDLLKHKSKYVHDIWYLLEHRIVYKKQVYLGDHLLIKTYPLNPNGIRQPRKVEFYCNDELVVDSETQWILIDHKTQKIKRLEKNWLESFN